MAARDEPRHRLLRQRRTFRERKNVLNELDDRELIKIYRQDRAGSVFVTDLVRERLKRPTARSNALSPETQIVITLRYLATGKMQQFCTDDLGPSQQTISRVITDTLEAFSDNVVLSQFIQFPVNPQETERRKSEFRVIAGFPE